MHPKSPGLQLALFLAATALTALLPAAQAGELLRTRGPRVDGQYIVVLRDAAAALADERSAKPQSAAVADSIARAHGAHLRHAYRNVLRGFAVTASEPALRRLLADPRVAYVEEDALVFADAVQTGAAWGLDRIDQRGRALDHAYRHDTQASAVHAYVLDTGIRATHVDFGGRVAGGHAVIDDGHGTADCNGHGTHVAGILGGATWGVAKAVRLHPVRVLGCDGTGSHADVIAGLDWVAGQRIAPAVANLSFSGSASAAGDEAVARLVGAGVAVAVAAGNDDDDACNHSPARASAALTVAATTSADARSSFSNHGSCVDLFAPGSSITSAWSSGDTATDALSGTSMAAPHVAGAIALYLANHPLATPAEVSSALLRNASPDKVADAAGSPNRLLYSLPVPEAACNAEGGALANGIAAADLCGAAGSSLRFTLAVPAGAAEVTFALGGGQGDADLYVRFGQEPDAGAYDCRSVRRGNDEGCRIAAPRAGTWHVLVKGHAGFAGARLRSRFGTAGIASGRNAADHAIADHGVVESPIAIAPATGSGTGTAQVRVDIKHSYRGDLRIDLVAPDGRAYRLKNHDANDSADHVLATYAIDVAAPARSGRWTLRVHDNAGGDAGYLDAWSIVL